MSRRHTERGSAGECPRERSPETGDRTSQRVQNPTEINDRCRHDTRYFTSSARLSPSRSPRRCVCQRRPIAAPKRPWRTQHGVVRHFRPQNLVENPPRIHQAPTKSHRMAQDSCSTSPELMSFPGCFTLPPRFDLHIKALFTYGVS